MKWKCRARRGGDQSGQNAVSSRPDRLRILLSDRWYLVKRTVTVRSVDGFVPDGDEFTQLDPSDVE
jgi:hypothetical protein